MVGGGAVYGMIFFMLLSLVMMGCFLWQYMLPKKEKEQHSLEDKIKMCPRSPKPVPLEQPGPFLHAAFEQVEQLLRAQVDEAIRPALSAIVLYNDTILWTGNFGKRNKSERTNELPTIYTMYRIGSISTIFPVIMLYKFWEDGIVRSLDDPLHKYLKNFAIKNPFRSLSEKSTEERSPLDEDYKALKTSGVTLRRMASHLSGLPRRLRGTNLLWNGNMQEALSLMQDDVLVAPPGSRCHYSSLAFSLIAYALAQHTSEGDYQTWVEDYVLEILGMEDTGFDFTPAALSELSPGFYSGGQITPLYDLGWYRPAGQMYSTARDLAKLAMLFHGLHGGSGVGGGGLLREDTVQTMLAPLHECQEGYFARRTGTPWELDEQFGYDVVRKDGDVDGYAATLSLVPALKLSYVVLMSGGRPGGIDLTEEVYKLLIPALEETLRRTPPQIVAPPDPTPYVGCYTYGNVTFYEIRADDGGALFAEQRGPRTDEIPDGHRTLWLSHVRNRIFRVTFKGDYPCVLHAGDVTLSLQSQDGQLFHFYAFNTHGVSPGFDVPALNLYEVLKIPNRPTF